VLQRYEAKVEVSNRIGRPGPTTLTGWFWRRRNAEQWVQEERDRLTGREEITAATVRDRWRR
jgi:hypothetical protein